MSLGRLERSIMEHVWEQQGRAPDTTFTVRDIANCLPDHAYTTVMTVMERLTNKGFLARAGQDRAIHYRATNTREAYIAALMHDALASTGDRSAALAHFVEGVSKEQAAVLRSVLDRLDNPAPARGERRGGRPKE